MAHFRRLGRRGPARGYERLTNITVRTRSARVYRHLRADPQYCDANTCRFPGHPAVPHESCAHTLETDVEVEVATADGAVHGTLDGVAMQVRAASLEGSSLAAWDGLVTATARLSEIQGSLRLDPRRAAQGYRTELRVDLRLGAEAVNGELTPSIFIETSDSTGVDYSPVYGVFPPLGELGQPQYDAGVRR